MCGCRQDGMEDLTQEKVLRFAAEHENASLALAFRIRYTILYTRMLERGCGHCICTHSSYKP